MSKIIQLTFLTLLLTSCETMQALDKGLYDVTDRVTTKDLVTGQRTLSTANRDKQIAQGNQAAEQVMNSYIEKGAKLNAQLNAGQYNRAMAIFERVHAVSHTRNEQWTLVLLPDTDFNAFVTGGTYIFINKGLMDQLSFDDEIAAVIAHEIAHVSANHIFEKDGAMMASAIGRSKVSQTNSFQAGYSTNDEAEADKIGILYMALAGYDPYSAGRIWQKMYNKKGNAGQMVQSHPISSDRMSAANKVAESVKKYQIPGEINPDFASILKANTLYQTQGDVVGPQLGSTNLNTNIPASQQNSQVPVGSGLVSALQTASDYYQKKESAKSQGLQQTYRVTTLQEIQKNMQIAGGKMVDANNFDMQIQYKGTTPVANLAIMAVSESNSSLYRHTQTVNPGDIFTANFSSSILQSADGQKPKIKLVVDEGNYVAQ